MLLATEMPTTEEALVDPKPLRREFGRRHLVFVLTLAIAEYSYGLIDDFEREFRLTRGGGASVQVDVAFAVEVDPFDLAKVHWTR